MANIFIGWSGNQSLAYCLEKLIQNGDHEAIVGGGTPKERFVGMQVINQINQCSYAVLLVEDRKDVDAKHNAISNNLMFEWGYIMAKFPFSCIFTMLIDKESKDLPSDLQGSTVSSFVRKNEDGSEKPDEVLAFEIYNMFRTYFDKIEDNEAFFDIVNNWKRVYSNLSEKRVNDEAKKIKQILMGCYAAYYYNGYQELRDLLGEFSGGRTFTEIVSFAKAYIDVFLYSANMTKPITRRQFRNLCDIYRDIEERNRTLPAEIDLLVDLLCFNAYSLAYVLYLKNNDFDEETVKDYAETAAEYLLLIEKTLVKFESVKTDECLSLLIKSYMYNDMSHIFRDYIDDEEKLKGYLIKSVEARKELYRVYKRNYPKNHFMITKFDQEYMVALSDLCYYTEDKKERRAYVDDICDRFEDWEKEISYSTSLLRRIQNNLKRIKVDVGDF